jgi:DNA/RNA endonuclease YhcR with UshA esterase domain
MRGLSSQLTLGVIFVAVVLLSSGRASAADCISFAEARHHIGQTQCVRGTVFHVKEGQNGATFLDFCEDYEVCPFTVVLFASDLRKVGNVRQLKGRQVQIQGTIEEYDGRAEIILKKPEQLGETAALLTPFSRDATLVPSLPADYDVERAGHYSAGKFKRPKKVKAKPPKKQGAPISTEDPGQQ